MRGLGGLGLDRELGMIMNANRANPEQFAFRLKEQQRAGITPQLLDVLASQKLLKEKQDAKTAMMASAAPSAGTIAEQQDDMLKQQAVADLQREVDVAKQVGMGNAIMNARNKRLQQAMLKQLTGTRKPRGIAGAPVPKRMTAAQGGIVGFQSGNQVNLPAQVPPKPPMRFNVGVIERQRERREWDELYGDNYNTDGTLKGATTPTPGLLERATGTGLGEILGQNLTQQGSGMSGLGSGAQYLPDDRRAIPKGPDFATQKFFQSPPIGSPTYKEETGTTPPMPVLMPPMQGPPMPPPSIQETPELPEAPSTEMAPKGIKSLQFQPKDNLAAVLRAFQGGNPAAVQSLLAERDRQTQLEVDKFNIETDLAEARIANTAEANKINKELRESIARGEDRNALFRQLNIANQSVVDAREKFDLSTEGSDINARINEARKKFNSNPTQSRRERLELLKEEKRELEKNIGIGALEDTVNQLRNYILALDFDMSKPAKKVV
jgi:hypothetical protein